MKLLHLRNATALLDVGPHRFLVDPMLGGVGSMIGFRLFGASRRRNPLVPLPAVAEGALAEATAVLLTHAHPDHLDPAGTAWIRDRRLPVWTNVAAARALAKKGLDARVLEDGALGMRIETVVSRHGRGLMGVVLGHVTGFYLAHPDEPSVYLAGDTILTPAVEDALDRLAPEVVVLPAGAANMGIGGDILLSLDDIVHLARRAQGDVVLNHLEALDHCPTTRRDAQARMTREGLATKVKIPADGEELAWERRPLVQADVGQARSK